MTASMIIAWEYSVMTVNGVDALNVWPMERAIQDAGKHGWELVSCNERKDSTNLVGFWLFFKRPKSWMESSEVLQ